MRNTIPQENLRSPDVVMLDRRLGAMHQNRISFVRSIIRKMAREKWQVTRHLWDLDMSGFGTAIYRIQTKEDIYHFVVFSQFIDDEDRNDRVIADKWDITFSLVQGDISEELLYHMRMNIPLQEAGRNTSRSLVLSRANKSIRAFDHVVESLKQGHQPDMAKLLDVGYILRTTAVYGNGKFGIADFGMLGGNGDFQTSFSAQMCACYILRQFSIEWVNHIAKMNSSKAVELGSEIAQFLGVGNATGLGMAPYLIKHPQIVDVWLTAREQAISRVSAQHVTDDAYQQLVTIVDRAIQHLGSVKVINKHQQVLNTTACTELAAYIATRPADIHIWRDYIHSMQGLSFEAQEIILSSIVELYPELVDSLENELNAVEKLSLDDGLTVGDMKSVLNQRYQWATKIDFTDPDNEYWFWYYSEDKEEPRLGVRELEEGHDKEMPLDTARKVNRFYQALSAFDDDTLLVNLFLKYPKYRTIARHVWTLGNSAMGDIQINTLAKGMLPIHLLRCKLAMFGGTKFDPRSDKWVRVTLFQGAPLLNNIHDGSWIFPVPPQL